MARELQAVERGKNENASRAVPHPFSWSVQCVPQMPFEDTGGDTAQRATLVNR